MVAVVNESDRLEAQAVRESGCSGCNAPVPFTSLHKCEQ